jgi:hypothetical protein
MQSSSSEALMLLPEWARRLSARGGVEVRETLLGTWRRDGEEADRTIRLVLRHHAPSAQALLESGAMDTEGEATLETVTVRVAGTRLVCWQTGRVEMELRSDEFQLIGGLHNMLWRGEPHRFRLETLKGAPVGDAVLHLAQAPRAAEAPADSASVG